MLIRLMFGVLAAYLILSAAYVVLVLLVIAGLIFRTKETLGLMALGPSSLSGWGHFQQHDSERQSGRLSGWTVGHVRFQALQQAKEHHQAQGASPLGL